MIVLLATTTDHNYTHLMLVSDMHVYHIGYLFIHLGRCICRVLDAICVFDDACECGELIREFMEVAAALPQKFRHDLPGHAEDRLVAA